MPDLPQIRRICGRSGILLLITLGLRTAVCTSNLNKFLTSPLRGSLKFVILPQLYFVICLFSREILRISRENRDFMKYSCTYTPKWGKSPNLKKN